MWKLFKAQLRGRWQLRLGGAFLVGAGAAAFEWLYEGRTLSEWSSPVPFTLIAGAFASCIIPRIETMENRSALLKALPVSTFAIAMSNVLLPLAVFTPIVVLAVGFGAAFGLIASGAEVLTLLGLCAVLWALLLSGSLWNELKPHLVRWPYGKAVHYLAPFVAGGVLGVVAMDAILGSPSMGAFLELVSVELGFAALILGFLMAALTVALFTSRETYVE